MTIEEALDTLKVPYLESGHHHCRPGWIQLDCPLCGKDSGKFHLGFNTSSLYFNCWRCGGLWAGKVFEAMGLGREKARDLARALTPGAADKRERTRISLQEPAGRGPLLPAHKAYLEGRGFDPEVVENIWKVEGIGISRRLGWRLYIPINHRNVRVSWTTRAIGDRVEQRYISASAEEEAVNHKELVYGLDYCNHSVVICEGPIDAWKIGPGAGALFGTAFSIAQVRKLVKVPMRYVCFDSSKEAQKKASDLAAQLSIFPGITENIVLDAKDPGEASPKEIRLLRKVARL